MSSKNVNLHPLSNSGEAVTAEVSLDEKYRVMSLKLTYEGYGQHQTESTIYFDNPRHMRNLAKALNDIADESEKFFKENP